MRETSRGIDKKLYVNNKLQVAATMGITAQEIANGSESFELLKQAAKDAGSTTQFSASQSAEALNYLALAGYSAEKAVETLPSILNLAAAGGMELASASDMVTDAVSSLGMETSEAGYLVDVLAKTSQKSNTSVAQLGEALLTVGGTAKNLSGGVEEASTAIGILSDNGIKSAEAGTALRNIILSLSAPTDKAAKKMKDLGLNAFDAQGNLRPLNETFNDLNDILSTMTQEEQTQVLNELFNKTDLAGVNALLANSGERFEELSSHIANAQGAAANMAETMNDNLKGRITQLGSALEGLGIEIYESLEVGLKEAVESAINSVGRLSEAFKSNGFEGMISEAGVILSEFMVKIAEYTPKVVEMAISLIQSFVNTLQANLPLIIASGMKIIESVLTGAIQMLPQIIEMGMTLILELGRGISESLPTLIPLAINALMNIVDTLVSNINLIIDAGITLILALADGLIEALPNLIDKIPIIIENLLMAIANNLPKLLEAGVTLTLKIAEGLVQAIPQLVAKIPEMITVLLTSIGSYFSNFYERGSTIVQNICNGLMSMVGSLIGAGSSIIGNLINSVSSAVSGFFDIGRNIVSGMWNGIASMGAWLSEKVSGFFSGIVAGAKKVLDIHSPSRVFKEIGGFTAEGFGLGFEDEFVGIEKDIYGEFDAFIDGINLNAIVDMNSSNMGRAVVGGTNITNNYNSVVNSSAKDSEVDRERNIKIEVPVNIDGKTVAEVTAPYGDKINGQRLNLSRRGLVLA